MVEDPQLPSVRRMAAFAFLAESALVNVIARMAIDARGRRPVEGQRRVALSAADDPMQSQQREFRQVVIENDIASPGSLAMTCFAAALEPAAVRILTAMAARAVLGELLGRRRRGVTRMAVDLGVYADQRKLGFPRMIIGDRPPSLVIMAVFALDAEPGRVSIVGLVAAVAVLRDFVLVISVAMAGEAIDVRVHTQQLIAGFLEVVVLRALPFFGRVALCAIHTARPTVFIVGCVTTVAGLRRRFVAAADMARIAGHRNVGAGQFEVRLVVFEPAAGPAH